MAKIIVPVLLVIFNVWMFFAGPAAAQKLEVMASIIPLGDFCEKIGGERVSTTVLVPPGASPHTFEPRPSTIVKASKTRVFIQIGAGFEFWFDRLIAPAKTEKMIVVRVSSGVDLIETIDSHHHKKVEKDLAGKGKLERGGNPHIWLDPILAKKICRDIAGALSSADPENSAYYHGRLQAYLKALDGLDKEIRKRVETFRIKHYVAFHPSFAYFTRQYDLKAVGVIEAAPGREPTPKHLMKIIRAVKKYNLRAIFSEPQLNRRAAEVIAAEANVPVLVLDPIGGRKPYGSDYLALMQHNLSIMEKAMR
jgi:zinc transport system substrate-binding protein